MNTAAQSTTPEEVNEEAAAAELLQMAQPAEEECSWCGVAKVVAAGAAIAGVGLYGGYKLGAAARARGIAESHQEQAAPPALEM